MTLAAPFGRLAVRSSGWLRRLVLAAVCSLLAACGGGVSIGIGTGFRFDDAAPAVSIAASALTVAAGGTVTLIAAASDADGIDVVVFFRLDGGIPQPLATLERPPYEIAIGVPTDGRSTLRVFARAVDFSGRSGDSSVLELPIVR